MLEANASLYRQSGFLVTCILRINVVQYNLYMLENRGRDKMAVIWYIVSNVFPRTIASEIEINFRKICFFYVHRMTFYIMVRYRKGDDIVTKHGIINCRILITLPVDDLTFLRKIKSTPISQSPCHARISALLWFLAADAIQIPVLPFVAASILNQIYLTYQHSLERWQCI